MIDFQELKRRNTGLVISKFAGDFRLSLAILVLSLVTLGALSWVVLRVLSDNILETEDVYGQQSVTIAYQEITKVRTEVNRLKEEKIIERTEDPEFAKQFQQLQHLIPILEQRGRQAVLDNNKAQDILVGFKEFLAVATKVIYILGGIIIVFVIIISARTLTSIRVMAQQLKDLHGVAGKDEEAGGTGDKVPTGNENEIDFARHLVAQAKNLQEQQQRFEDQYRPHLEAVTPAAHAEPPRTAVRFKTALPVVLSLPTGTVAMTAINYSETGILLKGEHTEQPLLDLQQKVTGKIGTEQKQRDFTGVLVRMQGRPDGDLYGLKFLVSPW